jgi:transcriptional regulator with XRE-family HTH domain
MEKAEHGKRLKDAMARRAVSNEVLADLMGVGKKTIYNWRSGATMPSEADRAQLRRHLGHYDADGDAIEAAIRGSDLTPDRQHAVIGFYLKQLREQREERAS